MWNPFKKKKPEPQLKIGDLIIGYRFQESDVWHAYGQDCLGYVASFRYNTDDVGYTYDIYWLEEGLQTDHGEERVIQAREEYLKKYGQTEAKSW